MKNGYHCTVTTPLALHGAEPRTAAELRAPSVRGAMRYWLRALIGGSTRSSDLREIEKSVFGSTEFAGSVTTRIRAEAFKTAVFTKDRAQRTGYGGYIPSGRDYLFWTMAESGVPGKDRHQHAAEFILPGTEFMVHLHVRSSAQREQLQQAHAAFWLLATLGGVGSRSRRGAGSLAAQLAPGCEVASPTFARARSPQHLAELIANGVQGCLETLGPQAQWLGDRDGASEFDCLGPGNSRTWVVADRDWTSASSALGGIGERLRDFRSHRGPIGKVDHDEMLGWFEGGNAPELRRPVFGLPVPIRYSGGGHSDVIQGENTDRRSSPLLMRITPLEDGSFVGVLTLFYSQFLPTGHGLKLQTRKWTTNAPEGYELIEDFVSGFPCRYEAKL